MTKQKELVAKVVRALVIMIGVLGFVIIFGVISALEHHVIGFPQSYIQTAVGFALMFIAAVVYDALFR